MRKHYLDNIRFLTIFFVVIFHVYFYYNNIGTEAMFAGLKPYEGAVTFAGIYQYFVYPVVYVTAVCSRRNQCKICTGKEDRKTVFEREGG